MTYPLTHFPRYQLPGKGKRNENIPVETHPFYLISTSITHFRNTRSPNTDNLQYFTVRSAKYAKLSIIFAR